MRQLFGCEPIVVTETYFSMCTAVIFFWVIGLIGHLSQRRCPVPFQGGQPKLCICGYAEVGPWRGEDGMEIAMWALLACQYLNSSSNCATVSHCPTPMYSISSGDPSSIYGDSFLHKYSVDLGSVSALVPPAPPPSTVPQEPRTSYCESHASLGITHSLISDQWAFR